MIRDKDFTGRIKFKSYVKTETDRDSVWSEKHYEGGIEVIVPEQRITSVYGLTQVIPEHTEFLPFTEDEAKQLKCVYDKVKKRVKSKINKQ